MKRWIIINEDGDVSQTGSLDVMKHYAQTDTVIDTKEEKLLDWQGKPTDEVIPDAEMPEDEGDED
jgi:hypothetical protein